MPQHVDVVRIDWGNGTQTRVARVQAAVDDIKIDGGYDEVIRRLPRRGSNVTNLLALRASGSCRGRTRSPTSVRRRRLGPIHLGDRDILP
jgi:hypothetical protein